MQGHHDGDGDGGRHERGEEDGRWRAGEEVHGAIRGAAG
jgi:hypothetical protein